MARLRILIADDHAVLRESLALLIAGEEDMEVVGQASDGKDAVAKALELRPDVLVIDITMPNGGGIQALRKIGKECPETRSLVLTMHDDQTFLRSVLRAGGDGYVTKKSASKELLNAIRLVASGRQYINVSLAKGRTTSGSPEEVSARRVTLDELSERERQVLLSVARGYTSKEIATELGISSASVDSYRLRVSRKLGAESRADLVDYALQTGLLQPRSSKS